MDFDAWFPLGYGHYLIGGLIIGSGLALLFVTTGLIGGMSTVLSSSWSYVSRLRYFAQPQLLQSRGWRLVYAAGLVLGAALWWALAGYALQYRMTIPWWQLAGGGFIAGLGARMANGCTSGHGICGLASLQWPSALAVLTFLFSATISSRLILMLGGR